MENIKLHTQKLLSQYKILNKISKKIINYIFNQFFKIVFLKKKKTKILIYISKYKISLYTKYQIMDFFYKIEKYLYFFIKKFIIKKKNQTFLKNIKLHTQKLLSQFLIRFPKKSTTRIHPSRTSIPLRLLSNITTYSSKILLSVNNE